MSEANELKWSFPPTYGIAVNGFHDSAGEHFRGDYEDYLTRESIQNSVDAHTDETKPVRVVFEYKKYPVADLPGMAEFRGILKKAGDFSSSQEGAADYYTEAYERLGQKELPVLRIGDYNTKGLDGADNNYGPDGNWARLVYMEGASSPKGAGGGSYGIGKAAAFTASGVRAVYYSTLNSSKERVFAGKARISSFCDDNGRLMSGMGQLGLVSDDGSSFKSVRNPDLVPAAFRRDEQGTDIHILDYHPLSDDWKVHMIDSALINFWPAIYEGKLVVEFTDNSGTTTITAENLKTMLEEHEAAAKQAMPYYLAMAEGAVVQADLKHLGPVKLFYAYGQGYPREVMYMRKPKMKVNTWRVNNLHRDYAAVVLCEKEPGNSILRAMEPPAHDNWDPKSEKGKYQTPYKELRDFVRKTLSDLNGTIDYKPEDVADLGKYVPDKDERDDLQAVQAATGKPTGTVDEQESPVEVANPTPPAPLKVTRPETQVLTVVSAARGEDTNRLGTKNRTNDTHDDKASDHEGGNLPRMETSGLRFRSKTYLKDGEREYLLILSPERDAQGSVRLMASGEDADYPVALISAHDSQGHALAVKGSFIAGVSLKQGQPEKLTVRLSNNRRYALGVETHER